MAPNGLDSVRTVQPRTGLPASVTKVSAISGTSPPAGLGTDAAAPGCAIAWAAVSATTCRHAGDTLRTNWNSGCASSGRLAGSAGQ